MIGAPLRRILYRVSKMDEQGNGIADNGEYYKDDLIEYTFENPAARVGDTISAYTDMGNPTHLVRVLIERGTNEMPHAHPASDNIQLTPSPRNNYPAITSFHVDKQLSESQVNYEYEQANKDFAHRIAAPEHKPLWLWFNVYPERGCTDIYGVIKRGASGFSLPIPPGILEADIRALVKALLRDGFTYKESNW